MNGVHVGLPFARRAVPRSYTSGVPRPRDHAILRGMDKKPARPLGPDCCMLDSRFIARQAGHRGETPGGLAVWENLHYGMFHPFGINTLVGDECPREARRGRRGVNRPPLDVDRGCGWRAKAGMKYAVLHGPSMQRGTACGRRQG